VFYIFSLCLESNE